MPVALLVAAGRGERLGALGPKAFVTLGGRPMLHWSLSALRGVESIARIVVAMPEEGGERPRGTIAVPGGATRSQSVRAALRSAGEGEFVVVHDAARPLVTSALIARCVEVLLGSDADAVVAAAPVTDTIKEAPAPARQVTRTLDRNGLWAVQTPQVFRREALERALDQPDAVLDAATDDAGLVEAQGGTVLVVPAPPDNLKVTTPVDLQLAELLLRARR